MRSPVSVRRSVLAAVVTTLSAGLSAGLVACGPDEDTPSADPSTTATSPAAGASAPEGARSSEAAGGEVDPQEFVDRVSDGFGKLTTARLAITVTSTGLAMSATGLVDYTGDTPSMALKMTAPELGEGTIDLRLIDQTLYLTMPMFDPSGRFFRIDLSNPDNPLAGSLGDLRSFDPKSTFETFGKDVKAVTLIGDETIAGDRTAHYRVTTDSSHLAESLAGATPGVDLPDEFTYEIWLDGDSRMRRLTSDVGHRTSIEMNMTDWGRPVDIDIPRADQIQRMPGG